MIGRDSKGSSSPVSRSTIPWRRLGAAALIVLAVPTVLFAASRLGTRRYYLLSLAVIFIAIGAFVLCFENRKPQARELVTLAVMSAIAVVSRAVFVMVPHFKPLVGIVMITGMAFGPQAGFLTGAVSGFVSNFLFGQGPWTPWQMFAYGIGGFLAGLLGAKQLMSQKHVLRTGLMGAGIVLGIVGPLLDTATFFMAGPGVNTTAAKAVYFSGLPVNAVHALATFLTLFLLTRPLMEKLDRIKMKYGMMEHEI